MPRKQPFTAHAPGSPGHSPRARGATFPSCLLGTSEPDLRTPGGPGLDAVGRAPERGALGWRRVAAAGPVGAGEGRGVSAGAEGRVLLQRPLLALATARGGGGRAVGAGGPEGSRRTRCRTCEVLQSPAQRKRQKLLQRGGRALEPAGALGAKNARTRWDSHGSSSSAVVWRDLVMRESLAPTWRELLYVYRRMEARGRSAEAASWRASWANSRAAGGGRSASGATAEALGSAGAALGGGPAQPDGSGDTGPTRASHGGKRRHLCGRSASGLRRTGR